MVPPCLINNEQSVEMLCAWLRGMWPTMLPLFKWLLHIDLLNFRLPTHKPAFLKLLVSSTHDNHGQNCQFQILLHV